MEFVWDEKKNRSNISKHGYDFRDVKRIFSDEIVEIEDTRNDYGERRLKAIGILREKEVLVVYTVREDKIRIISARRAHDNERKAYWKFKKN